METNSTLRRIRRMLAVGAISGLLLTGCASTSDQFEAFIKNGDYAKALDLYVSEIQGNSALEIDADDFLSSYLDEQWNGYLDGSVENSSMEITFDIYQNLNNTIPVEGLEQLVQDFQTTEQARSTYEEGIASLEQKDFVGAIQTFEQIPETPDSTYEEAQNELEKAKTSYSDEILSMAEESVADSDFDGAISLVEEAEKVVGELDELESFLNATYTEKYETSISDALSASEYVNLFKLYEQATSNARVTVSATMTANYTSATEAYVNDILSKAATAKEAEGIPSALALIETGLKNLPEQLLLVQQYDSYAEEYRNNVITKADSALQSKGYEAAYNYIQQALDILPEDEALIEKGNYYLSLKPVRLSSMESYMSDGTLYIGESKSDIFGNQHQDIIYTLEGFSSSTSRAWATYRIDQKYSRIEGTVFLTEGGKSNRYTGSIKIFGDDELLYSVDIQEGFEPTSFSVNVSSITDLRVQITDPDFYGASGERCLSNVLLYPKY